MKIIKHKMLTCWCIMWIFIKMFIIYIGVFMLLDIFCHPTTVLSFILPFVISCISLMMLFCPYYHVQLHTKRSLFSERNVLKSKLCPNNNLLEIKTFNGMHDNCNVLKTGKDNQSYTDVDCPLQSKKLHKLERMNYVACCFFEGNVIEQNHKKAFTLYREAASKGYPKAQYNLGVCYYFGCGVLPHLGNAIKWFQKSYINGILLAGLYIGEGYYYGYIGLLRNFSKAIQFLTKAAEAGNLEAQCLLGCASYNGDGCAKSIDIAKKWYSLAYTRGHARSAYNLALIYIAEDCFIKARRLLINAVEMGEADAFKTMEYGKCIVLGDDKTKKNLQNMAIKLLCIFWLIIEGCVVFAGTLILLKRIFIIINLCPTFVDMAAFVGVLISMALMLLTCIMQLNNFYVLGRYVKKIYG